MDNPENEIESQIKGHLAGLHPSRELFRDAIDAVTNDDLRRSILQKAPTSSPYQPVASKYFMKAYFIGVPVFALAVIAVFMVMKQGGDERVLAPKLATLPLRSEINAKEIPSSGALTPPVVAVAEKTNQTASMGDTSSVDGIVNGFLADADSESVGVIGDSADQAIVNSELSNYNSIKLTTYDNLI